MIHVPETVPWVKNEISSTVAGGGGRAGRKKQQAIYMNIYREIEEIGLHDYEVQVLNLQDRSAV